MNRFSKTQIYLHWITLLFVAITYAAMELRGWFPKGSSTYLRCEKHITMRVYSFGC